MRAAMLDRTRRGAGTGAAGAVLAVALSLAAAGCSQAGDTKPSLLTSPIRGAAELTGFATTVPEPADFVAKTRPNDPQFMPVGVTPPARGTKARSPDQVRSLEAELDSTLQQHNAASGRKPSGERYKSAAAEAKPATPPRGSDRFLIPPKPQPQKPAARPRASSGAQ